MSKYVLIKEDTAKYLQTLLNSQPGLRSAKRELANAIGHAGALPGPIGYTSVFELEAVAKHDMAVFSHEEEGNYTIPLFRKPVGPELAVWVGQMHESNGKSNFTAMLCRLVDGKPDTFGGITIHRSEYPGRCQYEADEFRWMIGELEEKPCILDYDSEARSNYVAPKSRMDRMADALSAVYLDSGFRNLAESLGSEIEDIVNGK